MSGNGLKRCAKCGQRQSPSEFYCDNSCNDGFHPTCKSCCKARGQAHSKTAKGKAAARNATLRFLFGIDQREYERLHVKQSGRCAICRGIPPKRLDIDHDHVSGTVRGLLCNRCNQGLGLFRDNPLLLEVAKIYLTEGVVL